MQALRTQLLAGDGALLGDADLFALLLAAAMPAREDPGALAREAVARFGSFAALRAAPLRELQGFAGFGAHSLAAIKLLHEAALRLSRARMQGETVLDDPERLIGYLTAVLAREKIEQFRILFLDEADRLIADEAQARGTVNHTPVYPREVVKRALELHATALILVHNHPSGDPSPSDEDIAMTKEIKKAAQALSIQLHDHLIIGNGQHYSFRRHQQL